MTYLCQRNIKKTPNQTLPKSHANNKNRYVFEYSSSAHFVFTKLYYQQKKTAKENSSTVLYHNLKVSLECVLHTKLEPTIKHKA